MADMMTFPNTVEEFMEQYKVVDTDGVYMSKGSELVPIFRMKQWFEHLPSAQPDIARDIATIIENEQDMRVVLKNAEHTETHEWTPVTEALPRDDEDVIVTCLDDSGDTPYSYTTVAWHYKGMWVCDNMRCPFVIAWMPRPEPWKGGRA